MAARLDAMGMEKYRGLTRKTGGRAKWTGKVRLDQTALTAPASWKKPRMVFVNSMSDLFHDAVPPNFVSKVWSAMAGAPQHTFQILTKRPERMLAITKHLPLLQNVWLGTSVESDAYLERINVLRQVPAAIRFISFEPLIASVGVPDLTNIGWAIVGGESGPGCRPMDKDWVEEIRSACKMHGTAFFFKQWGGKRKKAAGRTLHGRTYDELPVISSRMMA
jgi:protein gp37